MEDRSMKRIISVILLLAALLSIAVLPAYAEDSDQYTYEDFVFERLNNGRLKLIKYNGSANSVNIPSNIAGNHVERIGEKAFDGCKMVNVTIPDTVRMIEAFAFNNCTEIEKITIPDTVFFIDGNPFTGCTKLVNISLNPDHPTLRATRDAVLYTKNKENKMLLSYPCSREASTYTLENDTVSIGKYAFWGCNKLKAVTVPATVREIGDGAFFGCANLPSISLPDSLLFLGAEVFNGCKSLASVSIPRQISRIEPYCFLNCTSLGSVTFPENLTVICDGAFKGCEKLNEIRLPRKMNSIGEKAFYGCSSLVDAYIPFSVTSMGDAVFEECSVRLYVLCEKNSYAEIYAWQNNISYDHKVAESPTDE